MCNYLKDRRFEGQKGQKGLNVREICRLGGFEDCKDCRLSTGSWTTTISANCVCMCVYVCVCDCASLGSNF